MSWQDVAELQTAFQAAYTRIHAERFAGLPIVNPVLSVEVVGVRATDDFYTFSLLTPWMLNQVAIPRHPEVAPWLAESMRLDRLEPLGEFYVRNVISPMDRFGSMQLARRRAENEAEALFRKVSGLVAKQRQGSPCTASQGPPNATPREPPSGSRRPSRQRASGACASRRSK